MNWQMPQQAFADEVTRGLTCGVEAKQKGEYAYSSILLLCTKIKRKLPV